MNQHSLYRRFQTGTWAAIFCCLFMGSYPILAEPAVKIDGKTMSVEDLTRDNAARFYTIEQKKYELIETIAQEKYLQHYFPTEKARQDYLESKSKVSDKEVEDALKKFKDHPALKEKPEVERKKAVADYLKQGRMQDAMSSLLREAVEKKRLVVLYPEPKEPVYPVALTKADVTRFGPNGNEKESGCKGDDCLVTVVEYSDFECPFCERAQAPTQQVLKEYQGKIRWIVRDFPLESHARSIPAAIASHCAKEQGRYWPMYSEIYKSQRTLNDSDLKNIAVRIGVDAKAYEKCVSQPTDALALIQAHKQSGEQLGVTGTPTYFVNGRRVSGALPFEAFKRVIDQSLLN